jgi:hypothetical protein
MRNTFIILFALLLMPFTSMANHSNSARTTGDNITVADSIADIDTISDCVAEQATKMPPLPAKPSGKAFIVISKRDLTLTVYDRNAKGDTVMMAQYPCCMGKNKGNKQKRGDMRTPESPKGKPFKITMIQDASTWRHDFKDGRGNIKAYGHWFLRLETPGHSGIGIHGSTNNENTVPGRASEGCVRLLDKDIIQLKEKYARVGMPVIIKAEDQGPLPFE